MRLVGGRPRRERGARRGRRPGTRRRHVSAAWIIARLTVGGGRPPADPLGPARADAAERRADDVGRRAPRVAGPRGRLANELEIQVGVSQVLILVAFMFSFVLAMTAAFLGAHRRSRRTSSRASLTRCWLGRSAGPISSSGDGSGWRRSSSHMRRCRDCWRSLRCGLVTGYSPPQPWLAVLPVGPGVVLLTFALLLSTRCRRSRGCDLCRPVRARLDGRRVRRDRPDLQRRAARHRRRRIALAAAERWPLARDDLRAGAAGVAGLVAVGRAGGAADANPFFASAAPPAAFVIWSVAWVATVLGLAVVSLSRRDL